MTTLGYAILGLLAREDLSGYDMTRQMEREVGFFWGARHSQIYPELARLERDGLVAHSVVEQQERPDKKVYGITDAGLEELRSWVTRPLSRKPIKDELTVKAYSVWLAEREEAARLFSEEGLGHERQLARYEEIRAWMEKEWAEDLGRPDSPRFATYATLRRGILYERGYAEWCRWVSDAVAGPPEDGKPKDGRPKARKKKKKGKRGG